MTCFNSAEKSSFLGLCQFLVVSAESSWQWKDYRYRSVVESGRQTCASKQGGGRQWTWVHPVTLAMVGRAPGSAAERYIINSWGKRCHYRLRKGEQLASQERYAIRTRTWAPRWLWRTDLWLSWAMTDNKQKTNQLPPSASLMLVSDCSRAVGIFVFLSFLQHVQPVLCLAQYCWLRSLQNSGRWLPNLCISLFFPMFT